MSSQVGTVSGSLFQTNLANATSIAADANGVLIPGSGGGGGITNIAGDTGTATGATVTIDANHAANECGSSVKFTASGTASHFSVSDTDNNTFMGRHAGNLTLSGIFQTGFGYEVLTNIDTGVYNIGLGFRSGYNYTGAESSNININNQGVLGESNVIRIGTQGNNNAEQNQCFIAGIVGNTIVSPSFVTLDPATGQLGEATGVGGVVTLNGDTGSATGSTISLITDLASNHCGSSVSFDNTGTTSTLSVTNGAGSTYIGTSAGNITGTSANCVGLGIGALGAQVSCDSSTAAGRLALQNLQTGTEDTGVGNAVLGSLVSGSNCTGLGSSAGNGMNGSWGLYLGSNSGVNHAATESNNIIIDSRGVSLDSTVIRIGDAPVSNTPYTACFIGGIFGATSAASIPVVVNSAGQLGTVVSSERFKQNIKEISSSKITDLTPVSFTYKFPSNPPANYVHDDSIHYGMIAEDVHKKMPELVIYDDQGSPFTIKYQEMYALLLAEIKSLKFEVECLKNKVN